jgi:hypothetical protein
VIRNSLLLPRMCTPSAGKKGRPVPDNADISTRLPFSKRCDYKDGLVLPFPLSHFPSSPLTLAHAPFGPPCSSLVCPTDDNGIPTHTCVYECNSEDSCSSSTLYCGGASVCNINCVASGIYVYIIYIYIYIYICIYVYMCVRVRVVCTCRCVCVCA